MKLRFKIGDKVSINESDFFRSDVKKGDKATIREVLEDSRVPYEILMDNGFIQYAQDHQLDKA